VGECVGKFPFGRLSRRWKGSVLIGLREVDCEVGRCIELAQDRV